MHWKKPITPIGRTKCCCIRTQSERNASWRRANFQITRVGPVLSFFYKPDISYYGGDGNTIDQRMVVCKDSMGASYVTGTSFAAPWITRKMAYLIYAMGLSKEIAKALIIDAAAGWNSRDDLSYTIGYGVVPQHIDNIIYTPDDEIRFILTGTTD